jgi:4-hydroxy-2-oxoheptanedioate aldolase
MTFGCEQSLTMIILCLVSGGRFIEAVKNGRPAIQAGLSSSVLAADVIAHAGFDGCWMDLQHGQLDPRDLSPLTSVLAAHGLTVTVRVPANEPSVIARSLDAGAYAIVCPDVHNAGEAEAFAAACRYAPEGIRGFGPSRASLNAAFAGSAVSTKRENDTVMAIAQIESPDGLDNVEAIVGTAGIDGIFPGMVDYALLAEGRLLPGLSFLDPGVRDPLTRIIDVTHAAGKTIGLPAARAEEVPEMVALGADWVLFGGELGWLIGGARATLSAWQTALDGK